MSLIDQIIDNARQAGQRIILPEGTDLRVVNAAARAAKDGIAKVSVVANQAEFDAIAKTVDGADLIEVHDPATSTKTEIYAQAYFELRQHKGVDLEKARAVMSAPDGLGFAAMAVRQGDADGTLGGAVATTGDTVRTALQIIGTAPGIKTVSSAFLMLLPAPFERPVTFGDCALVIDPTAEQLAAIAMASAKTLTALTGLSPKVALLNFSTLGSAPAKMHPTIGRAQEAVEILKSEAPELTVDGEMQFDAAIMPDVAAKKAAGSPVAGQANVFVFPDLNAGNIGYKIAQRIGGAVALGPVLQGLAKPANDLSRGCSAEDVYQMIAITAAQAAS